MGNLNSRVIEDDDERIIRISNNLEDLDREYARWLQISYDHKKITDGKCLAKYGCTNTELYLKLRAQLLKNQKLEEPVHVTSVPESSSVMPADVDNNFTNTIQDIQANIDKSKSICKKDPNIVIIDDIIDNTNPDYNDKQLYDMYDKYNMLPQDQKNLSNSYSISIWGKSVPDMFKYMQAKLNNYNINFLRTPTDKTRMDYIAAMNYVSQDKLALEIAKLDCCINSSNRTFCESVYLKAKSESIDYQPYKPDIKNRIVPFLTPDEYHNLTGTEIGDPYNYLNIDKEKLYYQTIQDLQNQLSGNLNSIKGNDIIQDKILNLGWNPFVRINGETVKYARDKQKKWLETVLPSIDIINMSDYSTNLTNDQLKLDKINSILIPIFIVVTYHSDLGLNKVSKVGIGLDSISKVYTWEDGIGCVERNFYDNDPSVHILIAGIFVDESIFDFLKNNIVRIVNDFNQTYRDLSTKDCLIRVFLTMIHNLNSVLGDNDIEHLKYSDNPKMYVFYDGKPAEYKSGDCTNKAYAMINQYNKSCKDVNESDIMDTITNKLIENMYLYTEKNHVAESHLANIRKILHPESVVTLNEVKVPFGLDDKGLYINFPKDLQKEYEEAHKLLLLYGSNNMDGIKHELAHLYYIDWVIEKKLKYTRKSSKKYKELIDLRARVLNDFKKYFKIVAVNDPKFDFMAYLKTTEYYTKRMEIDYKTMEGIGKIIVMTKK